MKEKVKIVVVLVVILFIFLGIFFMGKKVSLNNYLNKTNKYSNKINYTTGITLNIESLDKQSKILKLIYNNVVYSDVSDEISIPKSNNKISNLLVPASLVLASIFLSNSDIVKFALRMKRN